MRKNEETGLRLPRYLKAVALGALVGLVISLLALLALSALVLSGNVGEATATILVSVTVFVGALFGGLLAQKRGAGGALVAGPSVAICLFLLFCLTRMIFYGEFLPGDGWLANLVAAIGGGSVGALISGRKKVKRNRTQRKK